MNNIVDEMNRLHCKEKNNYKFVVCGDKYAVIECKRCSSFQVVFEYEKSGWGGSVKSNFKVTKFKEEHLLAKHLP